MTTSEEDLCRWLYAVAGFSRERLAGEFEVSISEIERIVSNGLGEVLNPPKKDQPRPNRIFELNAPLPKQQPRPRKLDDELLSRVLAAAFD
jgi:hypothetical protein